MAQLGEVTQTKLTTGVFRHDVAWEVRLDLIRCETVNGALIETSNLTNEIGALLNQLALRLLVKLVV